MALLSKKLSAQKFLRRGFLDFRFEFTRKNTPGGWRGLSVKLTRWPKKTARQVSRSNFPGLAHRC